jgi:hypothetical protein
VTPEDIVKILDRRILRVRPRAATFARAVFCYLAPTSAATGSISHYSAATLRESVWSFTGLQIILRPTELSNWTLCVTEPATYGSYGCGSFPPANCAPIGSTVHIGLPKAAASRHT